MGIPPKPQVKSSQPIIPDIPTSSCDKMCTSRRQTQAGPSPPSWPNIYPDLAAMFSGPAEDAATARPDFLSHIMTLLGVQPQQDKTFYQQQPSYQHADYAATAPPPTPSSETPPPPPFTAAPPPPPRCCNCRHHNSAPLETLLAPLYSFSAKVTKLLLIFFSICLLFLTLSLLPSCLLRSSLYLLLATGLGLPLQPLLLGHLLHSLISLADPLLAGGLAVWALHKMFVRRRPLIDTQFWTRRFATRDWHRPHSE